MNPPELPPLPPPEAPQQLAVGAVGSSYHVVVLRKLKDKVAETNVLGTQSLNVLLALDRAADKLVFLAHEQVGLLRAILEESKSQRASYSRRSPFSIPPPPPTQADDDNDDNDDDDDDDDEDGGGDGDARLPGLRFIGAKGGSRSSSSVANKENCPPGGRGSRSASANARLAAASSSSSSSSSAAASKKRSAPDTPYDEGGSSRAPRNRFPTEDSDETKEYSEVDDDIDDDDDDDDDGQCGGFDSQGSSAASASTPRRTKVMWTRDEENALRRGVRSEGFGKWEKILDWDSCNKKPVLQNKTAVQIKDKARGLGLDN